MTFKILHLNNKAIIYLKSSLKIYPKKMKRPTRKLRDIPFPLSPRQLWAETLPLNPMLTVFLSRYSLFSFFPGKKKGMQLAGRHQLIAWNFAFYQVGVSLIFWLNMNHHQVSADKRNRLVLEYCLQNIASQIFLSNNFGAMRDRLIELSLIQRILLYILC